MSQKSDSYTCAKVNASDENGIWTRLTDDNFNVSNSLVDKLYKLAIDIGLYGEIY